MIRPRYLDRGALESPAVAIANAARETLRMGDIIEKMLTQTLDVFRRDDRKLLHEVEELDNGLDALNEAIKLYLTEVSRETLATRTAAAPSTSSPSPPTSSMSATSSTRT